MLAFSSVAFSQEAPKRPIKIGELNRRPVVGKLGLPLGTATEIEAQIISGRELRRKAYRSSYLLKVTHIGGKELDNRPLLTFSVPAFVSVRLANHTFGLHELKTGKKAGTLNRETRKRIRRQNRTATRLRGREISRNTKQLAKRFPGLARFWLSFLDFIDCFG